MPFQESPALTRASKSVKMRTLHRTSIWIRKTGKPVFLGNRFCLWPTVYILVTIGTQWVPMDSLTSHHLSQDWVGLSQEFLYCLVSSLFLLDPILIFETFLRKPSWTSHSVHPNTQALTAWAAGDLLFKMAPLTQPWIGLICSSEGKVCLCCLGFSSTQHRLDFTEKACSS